jgi:hypothetical protein
MIKKIISYMYKELAKNILYSNDQSISYTLS